MTTIANFLRSILLSIIFSFFAPVFLIGSISIILFSLGYIPGLQQVSIASATQIAHFLAMFGSGAPLRGLFVISLTCSFVGGLFDTYACYRCQILR
jgi:hypothetical protein